MIKEFLKDRDSTYSVTKLAQVSSIIGLTFGLFFAIAMQSPSSGEIAIALMLIGFGTPASKGYITNRFKNEKNAVINGDINK